ncbi:MAG: hypothetical protein MK052_02575 [Alphaproteobacteria bacterium]|nr:hypothetical protein [Alphaproteobacteria bacterium]
MTTPLCEPTIMLGQQSDSYDFIAGQLAHHGWCVISNYFSDVMLQALQHRFYEIEKSDALQPAGIGRGKHNITAPQIRRDETR